MTCTIEHDGIRFHCEAIGCGPALVFCHGLGGDCNQPKDLIGPLESHKLIVWDARGHGRSEPVGPAGGFTFSRFADDLRAVLQHHGIERAIVGGISMGAGVAARFAVNWPRCVRALVLVRPAWLNEPSPPNLELFATIGELLSRMPPQYARASFEKDCADQLEAVRQVSPAVADSLCRQFAEPKAAERKARLLRMPASSPIADWDEVRHLSMPALVVGTDRDPVHPLDFARQWARHLQGGKLVQIPSKAQSQDGHIRSFREQLRSFLASLKEADLSC